ncbi:MAG: GumC family protein [Leptolyngbyaceae cyanobacterium]
MSTYLSRSEFDIDLGKYLLVLKRRWLPAFLVIGGVTTLSIVAALVREPSYLASGKVLVKLDRTPALAGLDVPGQSIGEPDSVGLQSDPIATEVETIRSLEVGEKTIATLALEDDEGQPMSAEDFFKALEVKPIPGTDMIRISYESNDPELAAAVVNGTIDVYRANNITTKQNEAIAARQFITTQLPTTEAAVQQAETALRQFKEENQVVLLTEESVETIRAIQLLENEITQTRIQLATAIARSQDLQQRLGMTPDVALQATTLSQSAAVQETLVQVRDVQNQLSIAQASFRETHPAVTSLQRQEAQLQQRLRDRIAETTGIEGLPTPGFLMGLLEQDLTATLLQSEVERAGLVNRVDELLRLRAAQRQRAALYPRLEATQRQLERELTVAQVTYESLLQRLQDVQVVQNQTIDNIRVVSRALTPEDPTVGKKIIVIAGFMVGCMLGIVTAFAIDLWDHSVKTGAEAQELLEAPIVGAIPLLGKQVPFVLQSYESRTDMPDPYVLLQATFNLIRAQAHHKIVMVASAVAGEGRSRTAANLAIATARAGNRVLLIDADLGNPSQHRVWNCNNDMGLRQLLDGNAEVQAAIKPITPNLSLLPSGQGLHDDLGTFNPKRLNQVFQQLAPRFDLILVDTAPITQMADASTLGTLVDATLMVVRLRQVKTIDLKTAKVLLELSGKPILSTIINGISKGTHPMQYFASPSNQAALNLQPSLAPPSPERSPQQPASQPSDLPSQEPVQINS